MRELFDFPPFVCNVKLSESQRDAVQVKPYPRVDEWCAENLHFVRPGYASDGPFKLRNWQVDPANAFLLYPRTLLVGSPQTGKSTIADAMLFYAIKVFRTNGMIAYSENETVETVFKDRIRAMIEHNPTLRVEWNGDEDCMTVKRVKLQSCMWRIASAFNRNTLATFPAGVTIGSEVGKWQKVKFDPVTLLEGRQGSYGYGMKRTVLETSAFDVDDYMYRELYREGTLILHPMYPCVHCGQYIELVDSQIKLVNPDYRYADVMQYKFDSCYYECPKCKGQIDERDRLKMTQGMIWAAPAIDQEGFKQDAEVIYNGVVQGLDAHGKRPGVETIAFKWPRLIDTGFKFWENLGKFFKAKNDPIALKSYEAEICSRYKSKNGSGALDIVSLESKKSYYLKSQVPSEVLVITAAFDTQDNGWFYVYVGWGRSGVWFVLKHGFIPCHINEQLGLEATYSRFTTALEQDPLHWDTGEPATFKFGFMDRGGHRTGDVDYICGRYPGLKAAHGANTVDERKPLITESTGWYMVQTELLSSLIDTRLESDAFYIPSDSSLDFMLQVVRQYRVKKISPDGTVGSRWVHGGDDHYRDCLNLNEAAGKKLGLNAILTSAAACETLTANRARVHAAPTHTPQPRPQAAPARSGGYFNRAMRSRI